MLVNCPEVLTFSFSMCGEYFFLSIRLFRFAFEFGILLGISIMGIKKYCRENPNLKITCAWRTNVNGDSLVVQGVPHVDLETQMFKMKYQDFFYVTNLDETQEYGDKNTVTAPVYFCEFPCETPCTYIHTCTPACFTNKIVVIFWWKRWELVCHAEYQESLVSYQNIDEIMK